jgi:hypothetical protein
MVTFPEVPYLPALSLPYWTMASSPAFLVWSAQPWPLVAYQPVGVPASTF